MASANAESRTVKTRKKENQPRLKVTYEARHWVDIGLVLCPEGYVPQKRWRSVRSVIKSLQFVNKTNDNLPFAGAIKVNHHIISFGTPEMVEALVEGFEASERLKNDNKFDPVLDIADSPNWTYRITPMYSFADVVESSKKQLVDLIQGVFAAEQHKSKKGKLLTLIVLMINVALIYSRQRLIHHQSWTSGKHIQVKLNPSIKSVNFKQLIGVGQSVVKLHTCIIQCIMQSARINICHKMCITGYKLNLGSC